VGSEGHNEDGRPPLEQIEEWYGKYVAARAELVKTIDAVKNQDTSRSTTTAPAQRLEASAQDRATESMKLAEILPFLPTLIQTSREERSLFQQSTYLRHQLALTSEETSRTIGRLADESHLVTPGANSAIAWAEAALEASTSTRQYLEENLREGEKKAGRAEETLREIQARRGNFERLEGSF
jgi:hypothetical protein